jgi:hypothetical protein
MAEPLNFQAYRVDAVAARRRESIREYAEFCRRQRSRLAKRFTRSVGVIRAARRIAAIDGGDEGELELLASRKS